MIAINVFITTSVIIDSDIDNVNAHVSYVLADDGMNEIIKVKQLGICKDAQ